MNIYTCINTYIYIHTFVYIYTYRYKYSKIFLQVSFHLYILCVLSAGCRYGVATVSKIDKIIRLFRRISSLL